MLSNQAESQIHEDAWRDAQEIVENRRSGISEDLYDEFKKKYWDKPAEFVKDCIQFPPGEEPAPYQLNALEVFPEVRRLSIRGPHGLGKTALAAWIILWFALTRDGEDWKVPTTASAWRQLTKFLWPEIKLWARRIDWESVGRKNFIEYKELLALSLKLETGEAFALASDNAALIEGAHAQHLLYLFDEAKSIPEPTWDSAEGAFASGDAYWLSISTPGEPSGRFYEIQRRADGYEDWSVVKITPEEAVEAGRINADWIERRRRQWGEDSAVFIQRVKGDFASGDEDGIISLAWIEQANDLWNDWVDEGRPGKFKCAGVDVARSGTNKTVIALRYDDVVGEIRESSKEDTMATAGRVAGVLDAKGGKAIIDVIGIGAGVYDRLREQEYDVVPFNAAEKTKFRDKSGEFGFPNKRSAAWWNLREMMQDGMIALPENDKLTGDLTAPKWTVMSGARIQVESKDKIIKRINRSTDYGDAVIEAFWDDVVDGWSEIKKMDLGHVEGYRDSKPYR